MHEDGLKQSLIDYSKELGFCELRVAKAKPLEKEFENYKKWLASGYNADMRWMEKNLDRRKDVRNVLPGTRSVIVTAYNYYTPYEHPKDSKGKISRYAWGTDYHKIILPKLKKICTFIRQRNPEAGTRPYVDTGPILEKAWAHKSGIGWLGKNGTIINRKYGSWIFLGIVLTTEELEADEPAKDLCGTCTKCLDNCPTEAIVKPQVIDSNKCISYWTIEAKPDRNIPEDISEKMGGWAFGCDICQDVCPWNKKFGNPTEEEKFEPRNSETYIPMEKIMSMNEEEFRERFAKSPIKRPKLDGMKRNARTIQHKKTV